MKIEDGATRYVQKAKTVAELREGIVAGKVKASELASSYYERIAQINPELNVYLSLTRKRALEQAERVDAAAAKGEPWAAGRRPSRHQRCARDARARRRLQAPKF